MIYPMFAMVLLTAVIGLIAVRARFRSVATGEMEGKYYRLMSGSEVSDHVQQTTRSYNNQFEVPILFFAGCLGYLALGIESGAAVAIAWVFIASRLVHACIHLTYNNVYHRLAAYFAGVISVLALWSVLVWKFASA